MKTVVNGYEREGGLYREHVCEKDTSGECVSMCERPPMESETKRKRPLYTLTKDINCIQI